MRRFTSSSSIRNAEFLATSRAPVQAASLSSSAQSLRLPAGRLLSGSAQLVPRVPATQRLITRTRPLHSNLHIGRPFQQRFSSTASESVAPSGRTRVAVLGVIIAVAGGVTGVVYAAEDNKGEEGGFFGGLMAKIEAQKKKLLNIDENKKVLPDPHPPPYGKPITVVISDDVLLVQEYQPMSGGMLTKKRPGVEFFLAQLAQDYEVVIWSLQPVNSWGPVVEKLDPNHHASHRLFLDATVVNGDLNVKDLKVINRALEKTIVMDVDKNNVLQQENLILSPKYNGQLEDVYLLEVLNFFRLLAAASKSQNGVPDVRHWVGALQKHGVQYFKDKYAEAVRKAKERAEEERRKREEQLQMRDAVGTGRKW